VIGVQGTQVVVRATTLPVSAQQVVITGESETLQDANGALDPAVMASAPISPVVVRGRTERMNSDLDFDLPAS